MNCIIVVGCYRSGTSAAAGVLHYLGVPMGTMFDEPNQFNPKGFWEDIAFKTLHEQILSGEDVETQYINLIRERSTANFRWGVKDPKLCSFLPELVRYLDMLNVKHKVIHCDRPMRDIAISIQKAAPGSDAPIEWWEALVEMYVVKKIESLQEYPGEILHLAFDEIRRPDYVQKIADFAGVEVTEAATLFMT